jgi:predicted acyltransferase
VVLMPINKSLWTTSYCLLTTGWALVMFAVFYWLLDAAPSVCQRARMLRYSKFFTIYGMNALFIFALSGLVAKMIGFFKLGPVLYAPLKALPLEPQASSLLYALCFNAVMFAVAWFMWRKRWFVKV